MRIDHVAIAVVDLDAAVKQYANVLGVVDITYETVESEKVRVAILRMENASIELLESTGDGPIKKFLDKNGSGLHHIALETADIDGQVSKIEACGAKILGNIRSGSRGTRIAFVHPKSLSGVLTELCEHSK
ncbi:MAG: glyoxalase/bleomycin resistance protein/dioxygenase [Cenarchaeum symbiont of Oopsacas minuta]|nr:glyoxalase/bleomycin resistance protein/dioxygenase [Cenarchaeum symbiont of Oopsacas minuta]